jgi:addiction module HigA family antidote
MKELFVPTHRRPTTPGEILLHEFLKPMGITQTVFARRIGITVARLNEIIKGKRGVTPDTALRFGRALGVSPQFWVNLQTAVDLYDAQHSLAAKDIKKIRPFVIPSASARSAPKSRDRVAVAR